MSGAVVAAAALAGAVVANQMAKPPKMPEPQKPEEPPKVQAAQTPDQATSRRTSSGGGAGYGPPGASGTMLTGAGGIDPTALTLGKNSLLGQ